MKLLTGVREIKVNQNTGGAEIVYDEKEISLGEIKREIEALNYEVKIIKKEGIKAKKTVNPNFKKSKASGKTPRNIIIGGIFLLAIGLIYLGINKFGAWELLEKLNGSNLSYPLIFVIGLLASFHCVGMCGGIVIAYTSRYCSPRKRENAPDDNRKNVSLPHIYYNLGRIFSYSLTGLILGGIGSFFGINKTFTGIITLLAGLFMVVVGLSLITRLTILDRLTGVLPMSLGRAFLGMLHGSGPRGPFLIGFVNGFMPCGPLQAMQIYALASGSAIAGGLSMGVYALGTVPLMLGLGNIVSLITQEKIQQVMKFSGAVVVVLGLLTINRSFANFGENAVNKPAKSNAVVSETAEESDKIIPYQAVKMDLTYQGYVPSTLTVKKGIPVRWIINVKEMSGCTNEIIMPAYNIKKKLQYGENVIEFTPRDVGEIKFSCWMKMVWGKFIVVGGDESVSNSVPVETASVAKLPEETDVLDSGSGQAGCGCGQNQ